MYTPDKWTDKELAELEKRIAKVYKEAEKDLDKEVKQYFGKFALRDKEMQKLVQTGDMTKEEYQRWRMTQIGRGQRFEALRDKMAERFTQANEVANAYVNDATPSIYSLNRNYEAYTIEKAVGSCDFTLWDESTVKRLLVSQPDVMPYYPPSRALRRGIDLKYGKEQITKHVTSGILRGLAPSKIASELMTNISTMNRESAVRAARTGVTAAQNAGRMDSYIAAEKLGIKIKRRWICTKDARTRLSHGMADGQIVEGTKKHFIVGGYKMMFPGDASLGAAGHEIYNCRCTTRTVEKDGIEAEPRQMRVRDPKTGESVLVNEMSYSDWKKWKETGTKPVPKLNESKPLRAINSPKNAELDKMFKKQTKQNTIVEDAKAVNPKYNEGRLYTENCSHTVAAYEMRCRGYAVTATGATLKDKYREAGMRAWGYEDHAEAVRRGAVNMVKAKRTTGIVPEIEEALKTAGNGARFEIRVGWKTGGGHFFVGENQDGVIRFIDPQSGEVGESVTEYFTKTKPSGTWWTHIDNIELDPAIMQELCEIEE